MKLKSLLNEAPKPPDISELLKDIEKCTDRNDHTEARILIAKFIKDKKMEKILNGIKEIHLEMGSMPAELSKLRNDITSVLLNSVTKKYGQDIYNQINGAL